MTTINFMITRKENLKTTRWSGGTTTEIYIYPKAASYSERKFGFRISTAVVEDEQSTFTQLPGFKRHIMPLSGVMELEHENHHAIVLNPFEKDFFHGEWVTKSRGQCTDFNLMLSEGFEGDIEPVKSGDLEVLATENFYGFYILCDCFAEIALGNETQKEAFGKGDFFALTFTEGMSDGVCCVKLSAEAGNDIIAVKAMVTKAR